MLRELGGVVRINLHQTRRYCTVRPPLTRNVHLDTVMGPCSIVGRERLGLRRHEFGVLTW